MSSMEVAVLKFTQKQTCFIAIPRAWADRPNSLHDGLVVYEVSSLSERKVYLSWNGDVTLPTPWNSDVCIEINGALAQSFGFTDGQEVIVQKRNGGLHQGRQIVIKPVSADDWETLNDNAAFVERNLMNQIRLVWCGMAFPIWIPPSSCISVTVASVSPNFQPVLLVNNTEVVVVPNLDPHDGGAVPPPFLSPSFEEEQPSNVLSALKSLVSSVSASMTRTVLPSSSPASQLSSPVAEGPPRHENSLIWFKDALLVARVVPHSYFQDLTVVNRRPYVRTLFNHPTTVFVSRTLLPHQLPGEAEDSIVTFLASVTKVASPLEKFAKMTADAKSKQGASLDKSVKAKVVDCEHCVVRVFVVPLSWMDFEFLHCTGLVLISDVLRRQLGLDYASRVKLQSVSEQPGIFESVVLHQVGDTDTRLPHQVVTTSFLNRCREMSSSEYPLVLSSGGLVRLNTGNDPDQWTNHLVRLCRHKKETEGDPQSPRRESPVVECTFFGESLHVQVGDPVKPQLSKVCTMTLPVQLLSEVNPEPLGMKLEQLGGVGHLHQQALTFLELLLQATPLAQQLRGDQQLSGAVLLVTGQRGSGKSTLARALAQRMADSPAFAHVQTVDCASLSGKRAEKVSKDWERLVAECVFREPSVLLFDDLDAVVGSLAGPEQENSPTASYFDKMADVFLRTLALLRKSCSRTAVIVTGRSWESFHSRLTASHGNHIFYTALNIQPPNKVEREDMLRSLVQMRPHLEGKFSIRDVASKTEGCLARDLVAILDRATHSACLASADNEDLNKLELTDDDFESALEEFCPSSLRGLNLRTEDTLSWDDAGGLEGVKKTLQEVFFWPTKYPELFANSPIRPLSGLLLYGAPGTGKTLLAGIVASECGVNFISIKGPELLSKYIGASEQAVRNVFQRAQSAKPCIIFFDEFDSIAPRRGHDSTGVTDRVVNQLLTLLDGVETSTGVYVLAATSRPDLIDPALLRPGRLDKCLHCPLPSPEERLCILQALSRKLLLADDVDLASVARRTDHFSGADLQALLYTSQLEVVHEVFPEKERSGKGRRLDGSSSSEEPGSASDTDFFCAPAAGDLSPTLGPEQNRQLVLEVEALTENLLGHGGRRQQRRRSRRDSTALALTIYQRHLEGALTKTQASVSASERAKFDAIYALFRSGTSLTELRLSGGQRVTLA
ncbi:peroxisome biogenesis factor 1 [Ixodes scapularis]|uniref:peroxisome biogenesis factor 1 n=1 Tax=Ixodes scapularis TaxID=6945 RepID=UPI001A9E44B9|nr:peroxisome biogenesis factor 1 [Ixodes scapularis]